MKATCNKCQGKFEAETTPTKFSGQVAVRIKSILSCPHCSQTDSHWIYASDYMPKFEGAYWKVKKLQREWLIAN